MWIYGLCRRGTSILYDKGWELKDIQIWINHADIETTANLYTHISILHVINVYFWLWFWP